MKTYSSTVTLQEILNDITLRVYNQNKELTPSELLPLIQNEFSSCKFISVLADPYYDKQGNYITQEEKSLLKKLKPNQRLDLPQTMKCLVDMSIIPINNPFTHKPDNNKFVQTAIKLLPKIDAYQFGKSLTNIRKFIQNVYYNMGFPGLQPQQSCLYLYSIIGGTGKTTFTYNLRKFLDKYNLPYTTESPKGRWVSSVYSRTLVGICDEWMPPKNNYGNNDKDTTINKLNHIIDNNEYDVEYKGVDGYQAHSKSTLVLTSNFLPFDKNDRRYGVIQFNETPYSNISDKDKEKYFSERTEDEWMQLFLDLFESCPFDKVYKDVEYHNSESLNELIWMARDIINHGYSPFDKHQCTIRQFVKFGMEIQVNGATIPTKELRDKIYNIKHCIRKVVAQGLLKPSKWTNGNVEYSKYNLEEIAMLPSSEDDITNTLNDIDNQFERLIVASNRFIEETLPPQPDNTTDTDNNTEITPNAVVTNKNDNTVTQLSDGNLFVDKFTTTEGVTLFKKCETTNTLQEYVVVNKPLPHNDGTSRKNGDVEQNCFLLEIDAQQEDKEEFERNNPGKQFKGSKEEEESAKKAISRYMQPFYKQYKDCLKWICKSGRVSVHMVLKTNLPKDVVNPELRTYIFERINETFFDNKLDSQCKNAGRLGRNPNAVRDNGYVQTALIINENCKEFDVSNWVKEFELQSMIRSTVQVNKQYNNDPTIQELERIVMSTNKESGLIALDLAKGNKVPSGSNLIGAIGYMKTLAEHHPEFTDLYHKVWTEAHNQHPTNITSLPR